MTPLSRWQVAFEALRDGFLGDMALDDVTLTAGPCGAELSCSFEADACGLAASGQHSWLWQSNGTGTTAGPPTDHTTGTATGTAATAATSSGRALPALRGLPVLPACPACKVPCLPCPGCAEDTPVWGSPTPGLPKPSFSQPQRSTTLWGLSSPSGAFLPPSRAGWGSRHRGFSPPGHYMVVSTGRASLPAGHTATLTSQPYQPSAPAQCLAFWYQLSAGTPGECWDPR